MIATMVELQEMQVPARRQVDIPVKYRDRDLGIRFRDDIIAEDCLLLEFKTVDDFNSVHLAQVITDLKVFRFKRGFLINFNKTLLKEGIKRVSI